MLACIGLVHGPVTLYRVLPISPGKMRQSQGGGTEGIQLQVVLPPRALHLSLVLRALFTLKGLGTSTGSGQNMSVAGRSTRAFQCE